MENKLVRKLAFCMVIVFMVFVAAHGEFIPLKVEDRNGPSDLPSEEAKARDWGETSHGLHLSVYISNMVCTGEQPIIASVVMHNMTDQNIEYPWESKLFALSVVRANNLEVPLTTRGQHMAGGAFISVWPTMLPPNMMINVKFSLEKIFDMTTPGKYFVTAKSSQFKPTPNIIVELISNTTTVEVVAASSRETGQ